MTPSAPPRDHLGRFQEGLEALREAARLERDAGQARLLEEELGRIEKQRGHQRCGRLAPGHYGWRSNYTL